MLLLNITTRRVSALTALSIAFAFSTAAIPAGLETPAGTPILVISGKIESTNKDGTAEFDLGMLEGLGVQSVQTTTPWHTGSVTFEGVSLAKLMELVGASGETVTAIALNDYTTEIPIADFSRHGVILALKQNGEYMSVRDKGPLFVVYPFDSKSELQSQMYYSRSAWQLAKLIVK